MKKNIFLLTFIIIFLSSLSVAHSSFYTWEEWAENNASYLQPTLLIQQRILQIEFNNARDISHVVNQSTQKNNVTLLKKINSDAIYNLSETLYGLEELTPPNELRFYHERLRSFINECMLSHEAFIDEDMIAGNYHNQRAIISFKNALEEIRYISATYNPPLEHLENMDNQILAIKRQIQRSQAMR